MVFYKLATGNPESVFPTCFPHMFSRCKSRHGSPVELLPRYWHPSGMRWPSTPPDDLRYRLEQVLSWRSFGPVEVYAVFAEWCEQHGVEPPEAPSGQKVSRTIYEDLG
jgi:hypothetical protein